MEQEKQQIEPKKKMSFGRKVKRIVLKTILFVLLFFVLIVLLLQTPPIQNLVRQQAVNFLRNKLKTNVEIGKLYINFTKRVILEKVYIEDRAKDTLLYGGKIKVDVSLLDLISGDLDINEIHLEDMTAKVKRQLPDTAYNFQFVIDAFTTPTEKSSEPKDTSASPIPLHKIILDRMRVVYRDTITGNDMEAWLDHFDTDVKRLDASKGIFDVPVTHVKGLRARVYQTKPLVQSEPADKDIADAREPVNMQLLFKELDLQAINVDYRNDVSAFYSSIDLNKLNLKPSKIDLTNRVMEFDNLDMDRLNAAIQLGKKESAKIVEKEAEQEAKSQKEAGWTINVHSIRIDSNNIRFDNDNTPKQKTGIDYAHLNVTPLTLHVDDLLFSTDSISGTIAKANIAEQSGFILESLQTNFAYTDKGASLKDLYLKTPGTEIKRDLSISYDSLGALKKDAGSMNLDLQLDDSKIQVKDILTFVPDLKKQPAFANPNAVWTISSNITGSLAKLNIARLDIKGLKNTRVNVSGQLAGIFDMKRLKADLQIRELSSTRSDVAAFMPKNSLPKNITIPSAFKLTGKLKGDAANLGTDLLLNTDLGAASVKGTIGQFTDKNKATYNLNIKTNRLDLGTILQDKETHGPLTASFNVKGVGFDPKTADADIKGIIQSAFFKKYNYRDLALEGGLHDQLANADASMEDPNLHFTLTASANLATPGTEVKLNAVIDSINTKELHLTENAITYHGKIDADFPKALPDSLEGNLYVSESILVMDGRRINMDSIQLLAGKTDTGNYLRFRSDILAADVEGDYKLTKMGSVIQRIIHPYFSMEAADTMKFQEPFDFTVKARIVNGPVLEGFVPTLKRMDSVTLNAHLSDSAGAYVDIEAPAVEIGTNKINGVSIKANTDRDSIKVLATLEKFQSGTTLQVNNTTLRGSLANNNIGFTLNIKDEDKDKYNLSGLFTQPTKGTYEFSLKPEDLLLKFEKWSIADSNKIRVAPNSVYANNFVLTKQGQELGINSQSQDENAPLEVSFKDFKIATITGFIQKDSSVIDGTINGKAVVSDIMKQPLFTSDLNVTNLAVKKDTAGDVHILIDNKTANAYAADIALTGKGNDVKLTGNYYTGEGNFDMVLDIVKLPLTTAQAFSNGALRDASGHVAGKFAVKGTINKPSVVGDLNFVQTAFNPSTLNNYLRIDNEKITVNDRGIFLDKFDIKDSASNTLSLNGSALTSNFSNYKFDLDIKSANFRALNSTKKDNKLFYGQLYFNSNLKVTGTEIAPAIDGRLKVNDKTRLTVVLPQKEPGIVDREGVVEFVDKDAPVTDSMLLAAYDTLNKTGLTGAAISVNVEIDKAADLTMVVDEGNGDFLNVKGEALLNATINPSGDMVLAGTYDLEEGAYELSFNAIKRRFEIQKGSKITWGGEPTDADVDLKARYVANTAPLDLVKGQLGEDVTAAQRNTYLQKLPFEVMLMMQGKLLQPKISFDIILPDNKSYIVSNDIITNVRTKLDQLRQEEGEMNKQVFALLLLNRFVAENPFASSSGITASTLARQSVSKLMTEQLNRLASDLVKGVELNFDVQSSEDYTSGERQDRTDLNVGLSKQLLNDRLTVTVGSNFELESPQNSNQQSNNLAANVALNYRLSQDGRYQLRAYRKNEFQGVIEGYVIETGVGFVITIDYNKFKEIFNQKKIRKQREQRQLERKRKQAEVENDSKNSGKTEQ